MNLGKLLLSLALTFTFLNIQNIQAQDMMDRRWNNLKEFAIEKAEERFKTKVRLLQPFTLEDYYLPKNKTSTFSASMDRSQRQIKELTPEGAVLAELYLVAAKGAVLLRANISGYSYDADSGKFWAYQMSPFDKNDAVEFELWLDEVTECDPCEIRAGTFFIIDDSL